LQQKRYSFIVPCYNEAERLQQDKFVAFIQQHPWIDLWFVNDGSKDRTLDMLRELCTQFPENLHVHSLEQNGGKAEAIRQGMLMLSASGKYDYIGFIDADLSAPLEEILPLISVITDRDLLIVAGARVKLVGRTIHRSPVRHYMGRIFATYYDSLMKLRNYDTQCGLKVFKSNFAAQLFAQGFVSNWFFDIELFLRARIALGREDYSRKIAEVPLHEWKEVKGSKLKITDFLKAPFEVLKIYRRYQ
jgi:dolichyl-phosphate beta-glucosyltransferase